MSGYHGFWIEDAEGNARPALSDWEYLRWRRQAFRHVGDDTLNGYRVSTVFLGVNHQFGDGPPLLYETMIFRGGDPGQEVFCDRYSTRAQAAEGHARALAAIREGLLP
jgi:hypothetical protein